MAFYVGQMVVCVDDAFRIRSKPSGWRGWFKKFEKVAHNLNQGDTYSITGLHDLKDSTTGEIFQSLLLAEAWHFGAKWLPFPSFQFRPLLSRTTSAGFTQGAPVDSEQFDNRRKLPAKVSS